MIEAVIVPRVRDLGDGLQVRRILPAAERRTVGPFVFLDQMGPVGFAAGHGMDVRPHPHIGLATITWLFEGEILHRDSLGTVQAIRPGEVNWMTAGRGIVHSERTPPEARASGSRAFGMQAWVALPDEAEECDPAFVHVGASSVPEVGGEGWRMRLIVGSLDGLRSPVAGASPMFYAEAAFDPGGELALQAEHAERAAYVVEGALEIERAPYSAGRLLVFAAGATVRLRASAAARVLLLGGASVGARHLWWNFVSSSKARIEQAAREWKEGRFAAVPGERDFIPLPERAPGVVDYP